MAVTFGLITDEHYRDSLDYLSWSFQGVSEHRRFNTATARIQAAYTKFESEGLPFVLSLGDNVSQNTTDDAAMLALYLTDIGVAEYSGDHYFVPGNHDLGSFIGDLGAWNDNNGNATGSNGYTALYQDSGLDKLYYFKYGGVYFMGASGGHLGNSTLQAAITSFLQDTSKNTPVVFFCHEHISSVVDPSYANSGSAATIRGLLEADGNVQVVLQGHYHYAADNTTIGDIQYIHFGGSVLHTDATETNSNHYYIVSIEPDAVMGSTKMMANIRITAYGNGASTAYQTYLGA
jgi:hypothetical protein